LLVDAGADLELADADGVTPLLNAIINASLASRRPGGTGHFEVARYLIEQGADVNVADWYGQTPLWVAVSVRNWTCVVRRATTASIGLPRWN
jgi:ankyrin repeat protein